MKTYTKESLIKALIEIRNQGWIPTYRKNNDGGIGNTLEDLLGIEENNLPLPNASEWELKTQKKDSTSLITLFHIEPSPRAYKFIQAIENGSIYIDFDARTGHNHGTKFRLRKDITIDLYSEVKTY